MNWFTRKVAQLLNVQVYPEDPDEQRRIKAGLLGARGNVTYLSYDEVEDAPADEPGKTQNGEAPASEAPKDAPPNGPPKNLPPSDPVMFR